jgi:hypothetical protein
VRNFSNERVKILEIEYENLRNIEHMKNQSMEIRFYKDYFTLKPTNFSGPSYRENGGNNLNNMNAANIGNSNNANLGSN